MEICTVSTIYNLYLNAEAKHYNAMLSNKLKQTENNDSNNVCKNMSEMKLQMDYIIDHYWP